MTGYSFSNFSFYSWKLLLSQLQFSPLSFTSLHKFPLNLLLTESSNGLTGNSIGWFFTVFDREVDQEPGETTDPEAKKRGIRWGAILWFRLRMRKRKGDRVDPAVWTLVWKPGGHFPGEGQNRVRGKKHKSDVCEERRRPGIFFAVTPSFRTIYFQHFKQTGSLMLSEALVCTLKFSLHFSHWLLHQVWSSLWWN